MVQRILGRASLREAREQQAGLIASLILERASDWFSDETSTVPPEAADVVDRLGDSLQHH